MPRFDRYLLSQLLALFGFFSLLLVSVYWVNRAVGLFDQLIGDGQSALVFVEFSLLTLPNVIRLVLPISSFAAAVYIANRLMSDSELVVMQATGFSSFRLARPVIVFGLIVMLMMSALTHVLVPASRAALTERSAEIADNVTARFLRDGQFMHPATGMTLYIREISQNGELRDVFLSDDRNAGTTVTYTARRALLARGDQGPKLLMFDGMTQDLDHASRRLSVTRFADVTYDLGALLGGGVQGARTVDEVSTLELLRADDALVAEVRSTRANLLQEGHSRIAQPFLAVAAALIGFGALLLGAFSRFGLWRQIGVAVVLLIVVQMINTQGTGLAIRSENAWPAVYAAPIVGIAIGLSLLWLSQRPRWLSREQRAAAGALA
ncbi:LPS export ABC transporter permease LptF [Pseudotabrizicola sp.]|uniref:LPS export ABC transporter permease LptF n=1 Tax=Pseudotabrizicola sp. TaxID=2939647 RepID=UPI00271EE893|nr:LPS export ABC transporter permease LptF [Pseudotabrizicola sp.]MDO8885039.1 LPS export ABC transporter permease LptF [Pseudotabrizicola sp.]